MLCLWGVILNTIIDMGIPNPWWVAVFPSQGVLNCTSGGMEQGSSQTRKYACIRLCS